MDARMEERIERLEGIGLKWNGDSYIYKDVNFHWTEIMAMTDEQFDSAFNGAVERIYQLKKDA